MEPEKEEKIKENLSKIRVLKFYVQQFNELVERSHSSMIDIFDDSEFNIKKRFNDEINRLRIELCKLREE